MKLSFLTLFPGEMEGFFLKGIVGRAVKNRLLDLQFVNIRDFAPEPHKKVDDKVFGGGPGMLLTAPVIAAALNSVDQSRPFRIIYPCPKGRRFSQDTADEMSKAEHLVFLSGYYEGIDARVFDMFPIERFSVGDFVLSSGDLPALIFAESIVRLIPGIVGKTESIQEDSIISGLLEAPHYTLPRCVAEHVVPELLLSGNHGKIENWRRKMALRETLFVRPSLLAAADISTADMHRVTEILKEEDDL